MRYIDLYENNDYIFKVSVNEDLAEVYSSNPELFSNMIIDQGDGFWIMFCIKLKEVLEKEGHSIRHENYLEKFFIKLVVRLTCGRLEAIQTYVSDVLNISRVSHLFRGVQLTQSFRHFDIENIFKSARHLFKNGSTGFCKKTWVTIPFYLRSVGSLLTIFKLWTKATSAGNLQLQWKIPDKWHSTDSGLPKKFEEYLRNKWSNKLPEILNFDRESIIWWDVAYKANDVSNETVVKKCSRLRDAIMKNVKESLDTFQKFSGNENDRICTFHLINNYPLGANIIFPENNDIHFIFFAAACRELYLTNSSEAFHPYSQFLYGFWNASFGSRFWKGFKIRGRMVQKKDTTTASTSATDSSAISDNSKSKKIYPYAGEYLRNAFTFAFNFRAAMSLDSNYYRFIESESSWDSYDTIARLLWNMPLCLNWFEILLLQIYEFQRCFLPFIHFPSSESVRPLIEELYVKYCKRACFLVKAAIIVAEYIYVNESDSPGRCYDARVTLKFVISICFPIMEFLNGPAYQILEVIVREVSSNNSDKSDAGEIVQTTDSAFPDLQYGCYIPDVDQAFNEDRRSIGYWMKRRKMLPKLDESLRFFSDMLKVLQKHEKHEKQQHNCKENHCDKVSEPFYLYDKKIYKHVFTKNLDMKSDSTQNGMALITDMLDLLQEDQLLKREEVEDMGLKISSSEDSNTADEKKAATSKMEHFARVFTVCSAIVGHTYKTEIVKLPNQILLTRLLHAECHSAMVDAACHFIRTIRQVLQPEKKLDFPAEFIKAAKISIREHGLKTLDIAEAMKLLCSAQDSNTVFDIIKHQFSQLPSFDTGQPFKNTEDFQEFLNFLATLRFNLLHRVSEQQLCNTRFASTCEETFDNVLFPYLHIFEYSFVMEIAALKMCLRKGDKFNVQAERLVSLLDHRVKWLLNEFDTWTNGGISPLCVDTVSSPPDILDIAIPAMFETYALLIPLYGIFDAYLTSEATLHPVFENIIDILMETQNFVFNAPGSSERGYFKHEFLIDFCSALKLMGLDYVEKLLDDCMNTWNVPPYCTEDRKQENQSLLHYEVVYTTLLHCALLSSYNFMSTRRNFTFQNAAGLEVFCTSIGAIINDPLFNILMKAEVLLRNATVKSSLNLNDTSKKLEECFKETVHMLSAGSGCKIFSKKVNEPYWRGYKEDHYFLYKSILKSPKKYLKALKQYECFYCGVGEPLYHTFKICSLCMKCKWNMKRSYCSNECQAKDWKEIHCQQHKEHETSST